MRRQGLDLVEPQRWDVDRVTGASSATGLLQRLRHQRKALGIGPVQVGTTEVGAGVGAWSGGPGRAGARTAAAAG